MNKAGCAALLFIAGMIGLLFWIWTTSSSMFPEGEAKTYRVLLSAVAFLFAIVGITWLAKSGKQERRESRPLPQVNSRARILNRSFARSALVIAMAAGTIAWILFDYRTLFPTGRAEQYRDIAVWGIVLISLASLFTMPASRKKKSRPTQRSAADEPRPGNDSSQH